MVGAEPEVRRLSNNLPGRQEQPCGQCPAPRGTELLGSGKPGIRSGSPQSDSSKPGFRGSAMGRTGFHLSPLTRLEEWRVAFSWFRSVVLYLFRIIDSFGNTKTTRDFPRDFLPRKTHA